MDQLKEIVENRDDVTWDKVMKKIEEKEEELKTSKRKYKDKPIKNTIAFQQGNYPAKILVLDEIYFEEEDRYEYRFAYWVVSDKKLKKGKIRIMYGQYAMLIPPDDFKELMGKAKETNWDGPGPLPQE